MVIDTHVHLNDERFREDFDGVLQRARDAGVGAMMTIGASLPDSKEALEIARAHPQIYASVGIHPHEASSVTLQTLEGIKSLAGDKKVKAIGEIGLDYHYDNSPRDIQREAFDLQLDLAEELRLPVVLHIREAHGDALRILKSKGKAIPGVVHCYSGSLESAREYMELGLHISFTGSVTFKNAVNLMEVAKKIPVERLMVETDAPYMTPVPFRGQRNEPAYVVQVLQHIAALRDMPVKELEDITTRNAKKLFALD